MNDKVETTRQACRSKHGKLHVLTGDSVSDAGACLIGDAGQSMGDG
jgi:hypothetical protein